MKDFNGVELQIGDRVAYIDGYSGSRVYLSEGYVTGFTPQMVKVSRDPERFSGSPTKSARLTFLSRSI